MRNSKEEMRSIVEDDGLLTFMLRRFATDWVTQLTALQVSNL